MKSLHHIYRSFAKHRNPAKFVLGRLLVKTRLCRSMTIDCGLYRLQFAPSLYTLNYWLNPNVRNWPEHAFLLSYLRPGETVIDVGANQGMMAMTAASAVGPGGQVFAMEPHPGTFRLMQNNLRMNGVTNVFARNVAVGSFQGTVGFSDDLDDSGNAVTPGGVLTVEVQPLDRLLSSNPSPIALLKID